MASQKPGSGNDELLPPDHLVLTRREQEVLRLIARGATDKEIATELVISIHTVKSHVRSVLAKLQLSHRYEAARYARDLGLITPQIASGGE